MPGKESGSLWQRRWFPQSPASVPKLGVFPALNVKATQSMTRDVLSVDGSGDVAGMTSSC
jgi:hypothetical protein